MHRLCSATEDQFGFHANKHFDFQSQSSSDGFRLSRTSSVADVYRCDTESIASSSATSKQRIDMMFNDSRSVVSEYHVSRRHYEPRKVKSLIEVGSGGSAELDDANYYAFDAEKNDVQERIEKMFSEVSSSEREVDVSLAERQFAVTHLGSLPAQCKITSLEGLQEPLKDLYFRYRIERKKEITGSIQISDKGLNIVYDSNFGGKIEKLNAFSTIAIWASVAFAHRRATDESAREYAFLPIVAGPSTDKTSLFRTFADEKHAEYFERERFDDALFVVVVREPDTAGKQLVCHGFVCRSSEDAVIMATTLYRVLMRKLGKNRVLKGRNQRRRIRQQNPNRLSSIGEMSSNEHQDESSSSYLPNAAPPSSPPVRPPRKHKELTPKYAIHRKDVAATPPVAGVPSNKDSRSRGSSNVETGGDVLTKVTIPRSSSFLNTNRLSSRYKSAAAGAKTSEQTQVQKADSPLGFVEMFNELQSQEGLKTVDEILNVIINAEGMSFNELKPIYKEFLLKLALVLNKDELYHRSKTIMKKQKVKKTRKTSKIRKVIISKKGLKNVFHKPLVKLKPPTKETSEKSAKLYNDSTSTDSFFLSTKMKPDVVKLRPTKTTNVRNKTFQFRSRRMISTSEDSDYPNVDQRKYAAASAAKTKPIKETDLRPSSSGYFSFSECSYDTESCTCTSADKCYCSLSNKDARRAKANFTICSCDTVACRKRNKCYCAKNKKLSLVEQLKRKGFAISESSLSPDDSHNSSKMPTKDKNFSKLSKSLEYLEKNASHNYKGRMELYEATGQKAFPCRHSYKYCPSVSSDSSPSPSQKRSTSSDNLAVDYSMFAKAGERHYKEPAAAFRNYRRPPALNKPNVIYAELSRPPMTRGTAFNRNFPMSQPLPDDASVVNVYHHGPIRTCNCSCACSIYTAAGGSAAYPTCYENSARFATPFHHMNMENVFGYYP